MGVVCEEIKRSKTITIINLSSLNVRILLEPFLLYEAKESSALAVIIIKGLYLLLETKT